MTHTSATQAILRIETVRPMLEKYDARSPVKALPGGLICALSKLKYNSSRVRDLAMKHDLGCIRIARSYCIYLPERGEHLGGYTLTNEELQERKVFLEVLKRNISLEGNSNADEVIDTHLTSVTHAAFSIYRNGRPLAPPIATVRKASAAIERRWTVLAESIIQRASIGYTWIIAPASNMMVTLLLEHGMVQYKYNPEIFVFSDDPRAPWAEHRRRAIQARKRAVAKIMAPFANPEVEAEAVDVGYVTAPSIFEYERFKWEQEYVENNFEYMLQIYTGVGGGKTVITLPLKYLEDVDSMLQSRGMLPMAPNMIDNEDDTDSQCLGGFDDDEEDDNVNERALESASEDGDDTSEEDDWNAAMIPSPTRSERSKKRARDEDDEDEFPSPKRSSESSISINEDARSNEW